MKSRLRKALKTLVKTHKPTIVKATKLALDLAVEAYVHVRAKQKELERKNKEAINAESTRTTRRSKTSSD